MTIDTKDFQFALKADDEGTIVGHGAVFGNVDHHNDVIVQGAFAKSLRESGGEVVMLYQHQHAEPIGKWRVAETAYGLHATGQLVLSLDKARETYERLKHGLITGLSIGYETLKSRLGRNGERILEEIQLHEISVVTFPANDAARITQVKCGDAAELVGALRKMKDALRAESAQGELQEIFRRARARLR
jgi:uncharacterized protein